MSKSELHNWECAIEKLSGDNADKMLAIAQDIYNTAFVRGKNYISLVQEPCEDCISRQATIELIKNYCENGCEIVEDNWCPSCQREQFIELLKALPSVIPKEKTGHWNKHEINGIGYIECSECLYWSLEAHLLRNSYCPNCGAKMEVKDNG